MRNNENRLICFACLFFHSYIDDDVLTIVIYVYISGYLVNGFVSGSLFKQAFFPRTSPGWQRVLFLSAATIPCM